MSLLAPIDLTAVGSGGFSNGMAGVVRPGAVRFTGFASFVENVGRRAGDRPIRELTVIAHGSDEALVFDADDNDVVMQSTFDAYKPGFLELSLRMAADGLLHFKNCEVGQSPALLRLIADAVGVRVLAHTGQSWSAFALPAGKPVTAEPSPAAKARMQERRVRWLDHRRVRAVTA